MMFIKLCSQHVPVQILPETGGITSGGDGTCQAAALGLVLGCLGGAAPGDGGRAGYVPAMVVSCC